MNKPNIDIPSGFAENGTKEDFPNDKILNGFDPINPDILPGDCLNKFIDDTYKGLNGVLELYEGCVLYDSTITYTNKSLVFDITNDGIKFYHSLQNGNINHALTDTDYWEEVNLSGSSRNVGEIITSTLPLTDAGLHLLDGSLLAYATYKDFIDYIAGMYDSGDYPDLFETEANWQTAVTTYGVCGKFVYDSTNNTVRLPKITGFIEGTTDLTALGDLVEAGLPNITGQVVSDYSNYWEGAFYRGNTISGQAGSGSDAIAIFDASRSNSIYGNSNTVQPQSIKVLYYIVVATSSKTDIHVDIDEIATDLNGKADVDLTNVNSAGTSKVAGWAMPSNSYTDLTLGASDSSYIAPANGYFHFAKVAGSTNTAIGMFNYGSDNGEVKLSTRCISPVSNATVMCYMPVKKNDVVRVIYSATGTTNYFQFVYAKGSESEAQ